MNLKSSRNSVEMLNAELSNASFNQSIQQPNSQWASTPVQNKNFLNNLSTIYNELPSSSDTFTNLTQPSSSSYPFSNLNNQEQHTPSNDQSKMFTNSQFQSHYYNHPLHSQPILNNGLATNSLVNNVYDFSNDLSTNSGQKPYLDQHNMPHVVSTTNNFHHFNISVHSNSSSVLPSDPSINYQNFQLDNNLMGQTNSFLNSSSTVSALCKKRKRLDSNLNNQTKSASLIDSPKVLTTLKNSIKKEPDLQSATNNNQIKEENKQSCVSSRILNQLPSGENYTDNYDLYSSTPIDQNNHSSASLSLLDSVFQSIKFYPFQQSSWYALYDENFNKLDTPEFDVYADKGFNFSNIDDVFICQKKNHFQITTNVHPIKFNESQSPRLNKFNNNQNVERIVHIKLKVGDGNYEFKRVKDFYLNFYGVKVESPNQTIKIEQSQSDRSKRPFLPIKINNKFLNGEMTQSTMGRLHFAETTSGNMRKKGKPNPDQKFFYLVAALCASVEGQHYTLISLSSERIIVRASNPGQFENDSESSWMKSQFISDAIYRHGKVGINVDEPEEALVVNGNLKLTGTLLQPSDQRIKKNIEQLNTFRSLTNIDKINLYYFDYTDAYTENCLKKSIGPEKEVGVLAQQLISVLPDAVKNSGKFDLTQNECLDNFLVVNKDRLFFEGIGAIKELITITSDLKTRVERLESDLDQFKLKGYLLDKNNFWNSNAKLFIYLLILNFLVMLLIVGF